MRFADHQPDLQKDVPVADFVLQRGNAPYRLIQGDARSVLTEFPSSVFYCLC